VDDWFLIPPPANMTVTHEHKPVLYLPDGRVLVRQAGFRQEARDAVPNVRETRREVPRPRRSREG
jgi:hypothetical protein